MKHLHDTLTDALAAVFVLFALFASPASAEWMRDGRPLAATIQGQIAPEVGPR